MLKGIDLSLLIGPAVPAPVPRAVLDALTRLEVVVSAGETTSGFELRFRLGKNSPLQTLFLLSGGASLPLVRVIITATVNGVPEVLMDGVMTQHEVAPGDDPNQFSLRVKGKDLTAVMDYIDFSGIPYPALPDFARVALILSKYAAFGVVPFVVPSILTDVPVPVDRFPVHQGKDLPYMKRLADDAGYAFYLEPGPAPGMSVAYWGPELRAGVPQPALSYDMDAFSNVESLRFTFDDESATMPAVVVHDPLTKVPIPIPVPDVSLMNPPLGLVPPIPKNFEPLSGLAKRSPIGAALAGLTRASRTSDAVTAVGSLDVARYGHVLKARRLVGVRGVGAAFDGLYYVKSVTHQIERGSYKQRFTLVRNGLISTLPAVPV